MMTPIENALEIDFVEPFSSDQQALLRDFFDRNRDQLDMGYEEVAGFLFAAECSPLTLVPAQWLEALLGKVTFKTRAEASGTIAALVALQRWIGEQLEAGRSPLPEACRAAPEPMANFVPGSPLSRWSRGFAMGHGWLKESWQALVPEDDDDASGLALMALTFFSSRRVAESYHADLFSDEMSFEQLVVTVDDMLESAFRDYAAAGYTARRSSDAVSRLTRSFQH